MNHTPNPPSESKAPRGRAAVLAWTLRGLPELSLFESEADRDRALVKLAEGSGKLLDGSLWSGVLVMAIVAIAATQIAKLGLRMVSWPALLEELILIVLTVCASLLTMRLLHRRGMRGGLREQLLLSGVPVCRGCGYSLRGLPPDAARCSECGRSVDADVLRLLTAIVPKAQC